MFEFADSHTHLADPAFADDTDAVIDRARLAGARALICIGESLETSTRAEALALRHPGLVAFTCGVHPHDAASWRTDRDREGIVAAVSRGAVAVGECGLDYHYDNAPRETQRAVFAEQLALAATLGKPVIVHTRQAESDTLDLLREAAAAGVRGVLHSFTGTTSLAEDALAAGWYVSFSGIVTFRSWTDEALLRLIPADRMLVESDAPYLAPVPHRGKRNESSFVPRVIDKLAAIRSVSPADLAADTLRNTRTLFALASPPVA